MRSVYYIIKHKSNRHMFITVQSRPLHQFRLRGTRDNRITKIPLFKLVEPSPVVLC